MSTLNFKPFYIHHNRQRRRMDSAALRALPRGFTALIAPSGNERTINFQIIHCAYTDDFCKRDGRSHVAETFIHEINARELPYFLHEAYMACQPQKFRYKDNGKYNWVLKYLL